jgi:hypothetical protein
MRIIILPLVFLFVLLAACSPIETPLPQPVSQNPTLTPPLGTTTYEGCAFTVNVPAELTPDGVSWHVWFAPTSGASGGVSVHAQKYPGIDLKYAFDQTAEKYGLKPPTDQSAYESVTVVDYLDEILAGKQADFTKGKEHYRLLVIIRPDTMLGDLDPQEVIYEIFAQAPLDSWEDLEPIFNVIFESIQISDCGGI